MSHTAAAATPFYGLLAEFDTVDTLLSAAERTTAAGYTKTDAFSPFPVHGLDDALGFKDRRISLFVLIGGITGALVGYGLEYWTSAIAYPLNIGGRPFFSWVSFIPPAFETTILFAAFTAGLSMIVLNGLPQPYHPVFNAPRFNLASQDKFFLVIEASDPKFSLERTREFLASLHAREVVALDE
jgi:Protein of unknown function (DUF3341)